MSSKQIILNNGARVANLGLGTLQIGPGAVKTAIKIGYRNIDCAWIYQNEKVIGQEIKECIDERIVERKDLFITSKLYNCFHRPDQIRPNLDAILSALQVDYLDLFLVHSPIAYLPGKVRPAEGERLAEILDHSSDLMATWRGMEEMQRAGLTRALGVSNFNNAQVQRILDQGTIRPVMHQLEMHPMHANTAWIDFAHANGIAVTAYSSLGNLSMKQLNLIENETVVEIAKRNHCTASQVLLNYGLQRNCIVIPKSNSENRLRENFEAQNLSLSKQDMAALTALNTDTSALPHFDDWKLHHEYPF